MFILYELAIRTYGFLIRVFSLFNDKAAKWVTGRTSLWTDLEQSVAGKQVDIWIHCASLGEFEQGRPLIEAIRTEKPTAFILLTFFSPSGYTIRKNYPLTDYTCYLPLDTGKNAKRFLNLVDPSCAVFVKYEFWFQFLRALNKRDIPIFLVSGLFRHDQPFFKWYGGFFRKQLNRFQEIFVQDEASKERLQKIGIKNVLVTGDTRVDRVIQNTRQPESFPEVTSFIDGRRVFIMGSTWPQDERILLPFIQSLSPEKWALILAPHEIQEDHLAELEKTIDEDTVRFSLLAEKKENRPDVLLIDRIGILAHLYQFSEIAYIGGAFGKGLHNILEPLAFKQGIIFGPHYDNFREAVDVIRLGIAESVTTKTELKNAFKKLTNPEERTSIERKCEQYLNKHSGATKKVLPYILATFSASRTSE